MKRENGIWSVKVDGQWIEKGSLNDAIEYMRSII